jgi:hypothetical protein
MAFDEVILIPTNNKNMIDFFFVLLGEATLNQL